MAISESMALQEIMKIIALPGEEYSDGDCLDLIINVLEELGMPIHEEIENSKKQKEQ